jgi:PAS domain S-box-containing protein
MKKSRHKLEPERQICRANVGSTSKLDFLAGGGEMGERIRSFDWTSTPLGPIEGWSPALKTLLRIMLANRFPHILWWGPHYIQFYNDPYRPIPGAKHPDKALGRAASECWAEIWHVIGPLIDRPFNGGAATWDDDIFLEIDRHGFIEECHFTIAYSPVPDETVPCGVGGVLATVHEITGKVVGDRRVLVLRDLGARSAEARTAEEACTLAVQTLAMHAKDIPFALLYLIDADRKKAHLAGCTGIGPDEPGSPAVVELEGEMADRAVWPLADALHTEATVTLTDLAERLRGCVPPGPWSDLPHTAVVVPIRSNKAHCPAGFLVAGISARLQLDDRYRDFLDLVASQISTAIANAREYEEEKKRAEALAEIDRAKTAFFSNVSHEFRTPLTLMLGPIEELLARSHMELPPFAKGQLEIAHRNSLRLLRLVNTLLDFSRLEAGRVQAVFEPTDLAAFTADLASVFRAATERAGLRLVVDCPALPQPVYVDRDMWERVVLNLISNAFKFTFEGEIAVTVRALDAMAELRVRDTGAGIPAEAMPRLFERFHRVPNTRSRTYEGSGIGLALVQELIKLHGGSVRAESKLGEGATFIVTVPFGKEHLPDEHLGSTRSLTSSAIGAAPFVEEALRWLPEEAAQESELAPREELLRVPCQGDANDKNRSLVLVADDNADIRQYLARLLAENYRVQTAPDGQEALAAARAQRPDLVLSDVMMPNLDGFGLVRELRSDAALKTIPIILLSARAGEESRVEGLQQGADDYIIKPFSARELLARVAAHLDMARMRQEASEKIFQSEERYRRLFSSLLEGFCIIEVLFDANDHPIDYRFLEVNPAFERQTGLHNAQGKLMRDLAPEHEAHWFEIYGKVALTGEPARFVNEAKALGRWYDVSAYRIGGPESRKVAIVFNDISESKRAEEALRESEARFRGYFELGMVGMAITSPSKGMIEVNDEICRILGYERDELLQRTWAEFTHADDLAADIAQFNRAMAGEIDGYDLDKRFIRKDGQIIDSTISVKCLRRADGSVDYFIALLQDITDRKRAEEALVAAHRRVQSIIDNSTAIIYAFDLEERFVLANTAIAELLNSTPEQMIGKRRHEFMPKTDADWHEANDSHVVETGSALEFEEYSQLKGRSITWLTTKFPLRDAKGRIYAVAGISADISERKLAEVAMARAKDELEQRVTERTAELAQRATQLQALAGELTLTEQRERSRLAKILHDHLQQLLVAAKFRTTILGRGGDDVVKRASKEVEELIDESIAASRSLTAELSPPILHEAGLNAGLQWLARRMTEKQGLFVELEMEEDIDLPPNIKVLMFESVRELLFNTVKHAHTRSATVNLRHVDGHLQIIISDQGVGFDPTAKPAAVDGGGGFGLFTIRERLELMGGTFEIESSPGQGSQFVLSVPVAQTSAIVPPPESIPVLPEAYLMAAPKHPDPDQKIRVMLADDHAVVRQGIANLLKDQPDIEVVGQAADGQEAVELVARLLPDVILMDMSMPKLNGVEATRIIHNDWPEIRIIGLSMFEEADRAQAMRDAGAVNYIAKSGPAEAMIDAIRTSIRSSNNVLSTNMSG